MKTRRRYAIEIGLTLIGGALGILSVSFLSVALSDPLTNPVVFEAELAASCFGAVAGACWGASIARLD